MRFHAAGPVNGMPPAPPPLLELEEWLVLPPLPAVALLLLLEQASGAAARAAKRKAETCFFTRVSYPDARAVARWPLRRFALRHSGNHTATVRCRGQLTSGGGTRPRTPSAPAST